MRIRPQYLLACIVVITLIAGWLDLPGDTLDVAGIKDSVTVHQGLDLKGGLQVLLEARPPEGQSIDRDTLNGTRDTIEKRVNGLGVSEPLIQTRGSNQIVVELPGVKNNIDLDLEAQGDSGISGTATLIAIPDNTPDDATDDTAKVTIDLNQDDVGAVRPARIYGGTCSGLNAEPAFTLNDVDASGRSETVIPTRLRDLLESDYAIVLDQSPEAVGTHVSCADIEGVVGVDQALEVVQETALLEIIDPQGQFLPEGTLVTTSLGGPADLGRQDAATPGTGTPGASPEATPEGSPAATAEATPSATPTGPVYQTIVQGKDLKDAYPTTNTLGQLVVGFELEGGAADAFFQFTSENLGAPMSIVLDKRVISSPRINGAISNQGIIEGMTSQEVQNLVIQLKAGSLAVPLVVVQSQTVGPTLGQDSIDRSLIAGGVGLGIVALFMILYYRLPGALAVGALLIYSLVTFAVFKLLSVTLTLAGIAGFILSIGMAVDANILIFARLKEELRTGRSLTSAIEAGFEHAWPSIRDSNISSMITSAILYWFGRYTGASIITAFAATLFIGVLISMFSAITVTRTFMRLLMAAGLARDYWWYGVEHSPTAPAETAGD